MGFAGPIKGSFSVLPGEMFVFGPGQRMVFLVVRGLDGGGGVFIGRCGVLGVLELWQGGGGVRRIVTLKTRVRKVCDVR